MDEWVRILFVAGGIVFLMILAASLLFCAGLSDIVHWTYCATVTDFTVRAVHTVADILDRLRALLSGQ